MKILQVISSLDPTGGGPVEGMIQQSQEMSAAGHEIHTLSLDRPGTAIDPRLQAGTVFLLGPAYLKYRFAPRLESWLRAHAASYDVIVVNGMWQYHGYCVAKVARSLGLPYAVFLHGMLDPWFGERYPLKHLKKWLYWPWADYRVLRDARFVLFTTAEELHLARRSFWLYKARERLVGYGIGKRGIAPPAARETFLAAFPHLRATRNLLFLSRLHPKKGCDMLLDAFGRVASSRPELHLVMAGPDSVGWRKRLAEQAQRLGIAQRVTFTGMLKDAMKWGAYDAADAFVLPSHQENFGLVVVEALASGVPVLTTNKVNIWREIEAAGAGIVREDTPQGTDRLLADWLALAPGEQAAMRARTVTCFAEHFELGRVTRQLLEVLSSAAAEPAARYTFQGRLPWLARAGPAK